MPDGKPKPFISQKAVRFALDALLYTSSDPVGTHALEVLVIVDEMLADPTFPQSASARRFAVHTILTTVITDQLRHHRHMLGLPQPDQRAPHEDVIDEIRRDFRHNKSDLIGWSLLYHRYVRMDLGLDLEAFGRAIHVTGRTLRRYQNHGIRRLTQELITAEWNARIRQRQRRLLRNLPFPTRITLFGREHDLKRAAQIMEKASVCRLQITGSPGVGKTTFVNYLLQDRINRSLIDQLVWITEPASTKDVQEFLHQCLVPEGSTIDLREHLLLYRVAIVLDEVEQLQVHKREFEILLEQLSPAEVYLTSQFYVPLASVSGHIHLKGIHQSDAMKLMRSAAAPDELSDDELITVYETVGGNPLALKLAARGLAFGITMLNMSLDHIYDQIFTQLSLEQKYTWMALALMPPGCINLPPFWTSTTTPQTIELLTRYHLAEKDPSQQGVHLITAARSYARVKYEQNSEIKEIVDELINQLDSVIAQDPAAALDVVEYILCNRWPMIDSKRQHGWIEVLWPVGLAKDHHGQWRTILERYLHDRADTDLMIRIGHGISLRRMSAWADAARVFEQVVAAAGELGLFVEQTRALIELAVVKRYEGQYRAATSLLQQIEEFAVRHNDPAIERLMKIERAQIAIDRGQGAQAMTYLSQAEENTGRVLALKSEALMMMGHFERSRQLAENALDVFKGNNTYLARVHTVIGRGYHFQGELEKAHHQFATALTLFETSDDVFGLARAQSNLGALLIDLEAYDEARALLIGAERIQLRIGDRTALTTTRHNLRVLDRLTLS